MFTPKDRRSKPRDRDGASAIRTRSATKAAAAAAAAAAATMAAATPVRPPAATPMRTIFGEEKPSPSSPSTPLQMQYRMSSPGQRPSPSASTRRLANPIIRSPTVIKSADKGRTDNSQPVFVSDFPPELKASLQEEVQGRPVTNAKVCGGMDESTGLSWMVRGTNIFIWSHVSSQNPDNFRILSIPPLLCPDNSEKIDPKHGDNWVACLINLQSEASKGPRKLSDKCSIASLIMCSRLSQAVVYWPNIFSECVPLVSVTSDGIAGGKQVNSMIGCTSANAEKQQCVAIACQQNGGLLRFDCSSDGISRKNIPRSEDDTSSQGEQHVGARSVTWLNNRDTVKDGWRQMLLLTAVGLECWDVELDTGRQIQLAWEFDILSDLQFGALSGQKQIWLLDLQVDSIRRKLKLLLASCTIDRINSFSYMQYFIASYLCLPNSVQREGDIQNILPKARIEEEEFLYSMRLRLGGKPEGSLMILASDGTATVAYCMGESTKLYQFDLAWDAGKVVDACVLPSSEDNEEGSWLVLTEKAGVWAIPGKAVLLSGVEPPERCLSRKSNHADSSGREDLRRTAVGNNLLSRKADSEIDGLSVKTESPRSYPLSSHDEEAEALVGEFFQDYLTSGKTDGVLDKLMQAGAFEKEGPVSVFALASKSIVDTLAKHWTSSMVTNVAILAAVSAQLAEKQRRHQQFLHFLLASKCHEELKLRQRSTMHTVLEHGEKLSSMIWLREMHNTAAQSRMQGSPKSVKPMDAPSFEPGGALWDVVQITGEKARRNNAMLLDRDKAEVFYSRVSELEDLFSCISMHVEIIIDKDQPIHVQVEKTYEITYACTKALQTAIRYRDTQQTWYPSPEGLTPWYCNAAVRSGLWKLAALILDLKEDVSTSVPSLMPSLMSQLEELSEILLEAYAGAITAKVECEEEYRGLQMEYWNRRDTLLGALYQHAKVLVEAETEDVNNADQEQKRLSIIQRLYPPLVSLARRHAGYQTLWDICTELNDVNCLRNLMHESMGLREGRFSNFVFEQCYRNGQYSKLLRLGEEFKEELSLFLQNHKDLLWLHELFMQQFTLSSSTLHWLAFSKEYAVSATVDSFQGNLRPSCKVGKLRLHYRKRLLNLAKLSAVAGGEPVSSGKVVSINADIEIMNVQAEAFMLGLVEETDVLTPRQIVEICLSSERRELILRAFDVFAWGGDVFRRCNKSLLEDAWLKAAYQDDWITMKQSSEREGWGDEQHLSALQSTLLYLASRRCYSDDSVCACVGGSFNQILPLLQDEILEDVHSGEVNEKSSVETILMQHPDFADAGDAMLAAIRMGKCPIEMYDKDFSDGMEV